MSENAAHTAGEYPVHYGNAIGLHVKGAPDVGNRDDYVPSLYPVVFCELGWQQFCTTEDLCVAA